MDNRTSDRVGRELRFLKAYAGISSLVLVILLFVAFSPADKPVDVIRAHRVEILNDDGRYALVLAGRGRLPGPMFDGKEYPQALSGGRQQNSGMIFFNESGDEVGGLTYSGRATGDSYRASGGIMFDQFHQDQIVGLRYSDNGRSRSAGLHVWDRSTELALGDIADLLEQRANATGAERDSLDRVLREIPGMDQSAHRIFLGSENRTASLLLRDTKGRPRVRLYVDADDVARLEFLDEAGQVVAGFPR